MLLEVATWNGVNILRTSRKLALRSEASARFEKQLHPALTMRAQRVASQLLVELAGAKLVPGTIDESAGEPEPRQVTLRVPRVEALIGLPIDGDTCAARLERSGLRGQAQARPRPAATRSWPRCRPSATPTCSREADLIEEVARLADLDKNLPTTLPTTSPAGGRPHPRADAAPARRGRAARPGRRRDRRLEPHRPRRRPTACGFPRTTPRRDLIELGNPLSGEQSAMRTPLLGSLLDAARLNLARGAERVTLFESGHVYLREGASPRTEARGRLHRPAPAPATSPTGSGCLATGPPAASWRGEARPGRLLHGQGAARIARRPARRRARGRAGRGAVPASRDAAPRS